MTKEIGNNKTNTRRIMKLVQTRLKQLTPLSMFHSDNHPAETFITFSMCLVLLTTLGGLIWMAFLLFQDSEYICLPSEKSDSGDYIKFENVSAEPYNGKPDFNVNGSLSKCKARCSEKGNECKFFSHDKHLEQCYMYSHGIMHDQNKLGLLVGPTEGNNDVYVIKGNRYVEMVGYFDKVEKVSL